MVYPLNVAPFSRFTGAILILLGSGTGCSRSGGFDWMTGGVGGVGVVGGAGGVGGIGVVGGVGGTGGIGVVGGAGDVCTVVGGAIEVLTTDLAFMPAVSETTPLLEFVVVL